MKHLQPNSTLQGGKYRIKKVLGQGGFGITYLAEQVMLGRKVAIKEFFMKELCEREESTSHVTLGTEGSRETVNRFRDKFLKEARNIARLNHPNIVRIIDVFEENGTAYYVMEYAENGSLADKVKKESYLSEPVATRYILQVAEALDYVHQQKMNHLDIKPGNIMLNEKEECVLIDFGLSKQYDETGSQTSTTPVGISEGYAPMEQYKLGGVGEFSPETDIYALGATYFKLLTGKTPPSASDVNEEGIPIAELNARNVSNKIISIINKAMEGRKRDRFKNVKEIINLLNAESHNDFSVTEDEETKIISSDSSDMLISAIEIDKDRIRREAMSQYLAQERAAAEKRAIEEEIQRIKEEEQRKKEEEEEVLLSKGKETEDAILFRVNGIDFKMIKVEGGTFDMKETVSCGFLGLSSKEIVQKTTLSDYCIGETQITQALWKAVMGENPSQFNGDNLPVETISWNDCQEFIKKLNEITGKTFRLPTEAEWEFAARGGNKSKGFEYSGSDNIDEVAWYEENSEEKTHAVATKKANELGIYDMSGNVWEWCSDWYEDYSDGHESNPKGGSCGSDRVRRGGSWYSNAKTCHSLFRSKYAPSNMSGSHGFRLALSE